MIVIKRKKNIRIGQNKQGNEAKKMDKKPTCLHIQKSHKNTELQTVIYTQRTRCRHLQALCMMLQSLCWFRDCMYVCVCVSILHPLWVTQDGIFSSSIHLPQNSFLLMAK